MKEFNLDYFKNNPYTLVIGEYQEKPEDQFPVFAPGTNNEIVCVWTGYDRSEVIITNDAKVYLRKQLIKETLRIKKRETTKA